MRLGRLSRHIGVVAAAPNVSLLCGDLRLGGILMLGNDVAARVEQGNCRALFLLRVKPGVGDFDIHLSIRVYALYAERKSIDTTCNLRIFVALRGDITDFVALGLQAGGDTGQVAGLVDTAEVVVEIFAVVFIAGAVGKDDVRMCCSELLHCIHIAIAGAEDNVAAFLDAFGDRGFDRGLVLIVDVILADDLVVSQAKLILHLYDPLIMRVGIASRILRISDVDYADLDLILCNRGKGAARSSVRVAAGQLVRVAGAGACREGEDHGKGQQQSESLCELLHLSIPPKNYYVTERAPDTGPFPNNPAGRT